MSDFPERTTFLATVTGNGLQKSRDKGTPSVALRLRTSYDVEKPERPYQINLVHNLWLTYKTMENTLKTLQEVFGWKGTEITDFEEPILVGKKCHLVCEREEWQGEERWRVAFVNRTGGFKRLEAAELTDLVTEVQPMINKLVGAPAAVTAEAVEVIGEDEAPGMLEGDFPEEEMPF